MTGVSEEMYEVLHLQVDWGDGSDKKTYQKDLIYDYREQTIFNEVQYGKIRGRIMTTYSHLFSNNTNSANMSLTSQFLLTYNNGVHVNIVQPINILLGSYYDEIGDLNILNTRIISNKTNDTFINFESHLSNQTFIGILSSN
jgi:hypothetical protein